MIDPKELRIGNFVQVVKHKGERRIMHFMGTLVGVDNIHVSPTDDFREYSFTDIKPIELTREWLERLGFTKTPDELAHEIVWQYNGFSHLEIMKIDVGYWAIISQRGSGKEFSRTNLRKLYYVHQLQNLYYFLTGKELETIN